MKMNLFKVFVASILMALAVCQETTSLRGSVHDIENLNSAEEDIDRQLQYRRGDGWDDNRRRRRRSDGWDDDRRRRRRYRRYKRRGRRRYRRWRHGYGMGGRRRYWNENEDIDSKPNSDNKGDDLDGNENQENGWWYWYGGDYWPRSYNDPYWWEDGYDDEDYDD